MYVSHFPTQHHTCTHRGTTSPACFMYKNRSENSSSRYVPFVVAVLARFTASQSATISGLYFCACPIKRFIHVMMRCSYRLFDAPNARLLLEQQQQQQKQEIAIFWCAVVVCCCPVPAWHCQGWLLVKLGSRSGWKWGEPRIVGTDCCWWPVVLFKWSFVQLVISLGWHHCWYGLIVAMDLNGK